MTQLPMQCDIVDVILAFVLVLGNLLALAVWWWLARPLVLPLWRCLRHAFRMVDNGFATAYEITRWM